MPSSMTYTYCAAATDLTDAEIVAIIRHHQCCAEGGELDEGDLSLLMLKAGCDLEKGHSGPHSSFQATNQGGKDCAWLFWGGVVREIAWPAECPAKMDGLSCLLFGEHEGRHLHYTGEGEPPAWLRHECPNRPKAAA